MDKFKYLTKIFEEFWINCKPALIKEIAADYSWPYVIYNSQLFIDVLYDLILFRWLGIKF